MANIGFDHFNKYILHDETDISIDALEVYSKAKDEEDFPHIGMTTGIIMTASGKDPLGGGKFTGVTTVLQNGWTYKSRTIPASPIQVKIFNANTIATGVNPIFTNVDKVHYEFDQSTSPALISTGGIEPTQAEIREAMTLATGAIIAPDSIDDKLDTIIAGGTGGSSTRRSMDI